MIVFSKERFYLAHCCEFPGYTFDTTQRDVICADCGNIIGTQVRWEVYDDRKFIFQEDREKDKYHYCPYCGSEMVSKQ